MDAVISFLWFLPSLVFGIGTVITLLAIRRAPVATEDEDGFRYHPRSGRSLEARQRQASGTIPPMGARLA